MNLLKAAYKVLSRLEGLGIALVLLVLYTVLIISAPTVFTRPMIYFSFLETVPPALIAALGLTLVITAGEIDLSFPAVVSLSGLALAWGWKTFDPAYSAVIGIVLALAAGAVVGYINGLMVARIGVPSIMATLAANFFWYGISILLAGGRQQTLAGSEENSVHELLVGRPFLGIPLQAFWSLALAVFLWFILNRHKFGESVMFIGDNPNVARVMGVNVEATRIWLFTLHGMIAAFSGIVLTLFIGVFYPNQGNFLLPAMASVFVGGTSIAGGAGSIFGTFFGSYVIGSLEAGVVATTISGYWVQVVEGGVMAAVVILNAATGKADFASLLNRFRHWSTPERANPELLSKDETR
ncbi:MAG: ABC transporter permease [Verrucomicrobia bacterium]|nr:ABC transporter permease [Verrucomicrobiota bacterium]MBV8277002.1 ABC transporter permease [Verrucomicrobiota bacterium]